MPEHATITRFAPSPTGLLHLGHAYSALFAEAEARRAGGRFLLRVEDIDHGRCRPGFREAIYEDLAWLGLSWEEPVRVQSDHMSDYTGALDTLTKSELLYPCFCTRKEIQTEIAAAGHAPHMAPGGLDGPLYPGTCRHVDPQAAQDRINAGAPHALRLKMDIATARTGPLIWQDIGQGEQTAQPALFGDAVLARKDSLTSYHLSVTLDDHLQGVTVVTRGDDLFGATHLHRLLQALLDLDTPDYRHHKLITDADGKRFAKRDKAQTLQSFREAGKSPADVRALAGWRDET